MAKYKIHNSKVTLVVQKIKLSECAIRMNDNVEKEDRWTGKGKPDHIIVY